MAEVLARRMIDDPQPDLIAAGGDVLADALPEGAVAGAGAAGATQTPGSEAKP